MRNKQNWKEFYFKDFFNAHRGKRIVKDIDFFENKTDEFRFPVITAKTSDNGIDGYYYDFNCEGDALIACGEANGMYCTYQQNKCWIMDTARIITFKDGRKFTKQLALFIGTILKFNMYKFSYGRKAKPSNIENLNIILPVDENGMPDWQYMSDYIDEIEMRERERGESIRNTLNTNVSNLRYKTQSDKICDASWKEIEIGELFECLLSKGDIKEELALEGDVPLVSSGSTNNGIVKYIDSFGDGKALMFEGNCLTLDMFCNCFYQPKNFFAVSHGRINILKPKFNMNLYTGLFIATVIDRQKYLFSYGRAVYSSVANKIKIKLPCKNGQIDLDFMENFMKSLPYSDRISN